MMSLTVIDSQVLREGLFITVDDPKRELRSGCRVIDEHGRAFIVKSLAHVCKPHDPYIHPLLVGHKQIGKELRIV